MAKTVTGGSPIDKYPMVAARTLSFRLRRKHATTVQERCYSPFSTRMPFLSSVLFLVLACIALIEVAFQTGTKVLPEPATATRKAKAIFPRQSDSSSPVPLPTSQADAYITEGSVCALTETDIIYGVSTEGSWSPTSTYYGDVTGAANCAVVTVTLVSESYISEPEPTTTDTGYGTLDDCIVTAEVVEEITAYSSDKSVVPVATGLYTTFLGDSGTECTTITESRQTTRFITIATPTCTAEYAEIITAYRSDGSIFLLATATYSTINGEIASDCTTVTITTVSTEFITISTPPPTPTCTAEYEIVEEVTAYYSESRAIPIATGTYSTLLGQSGPDCTTVTLSTATTEFIAISTTMSSPQCKIEVDIVIEAEVNVDGSMIDLVTQTSTRTSGASGKDCDTVTIWTTKTAAITESTAAAVSSAYIAYGTPASTEPVLPTSAYITVSTALFNGYSTTPPYTESHNSHISNLIPTTTTRFTTQGSSVSYSHITLSNVKPASHPGTGHSQNPSSVPFTTSGSVASPTASSDDRVITVIALPPAETVTASPTGSFATSSTAAPAVLPTAQSSQLKLSSHFSEFDYFCASYLAVFITVFLKGLWSIVFISVKMMEPFYQLQKPDGATVQDSLLANYLSTWLSWKNLRAIFGGQWVMMVTTIIYGFIALLSPLATECMKVLPQAYCSLDDGGQQPCDPVWLLNRPFARALQGLLATIALLIILLMVISFRRRSGVYSNPSSIASLASLLHEDNLLDELRDIPHSASDGAITKALAGERYRIEHYHSAASNVASYGLVNADDSHSHYPNQRSKYGALANPHSRYLLDSPSGSHSHFAPRFLRDSTFLLLLVGLFSIVLGYYLTSADDAFNRFFNSGTFGPRFLLTFLAVLINFQWKTIEREVRVLVPYRQLSTRRARPAATILVTFNKTPLTGLPSALKRREWFHAFICFVAVLSDLLIIAIAGVPFNRSQVWTAFLASAYTSLAVLGLMIFSLFALFYWRVQNERLGVPREPDTIIRVCMMLCNKDNGVRQEFRGFEKMSGKETERVCRENQGLYFAGWRRNEVDNSVRWVVDRDGEGTVVEYGQNL